MNNKKLQNQALFAFESNNSNPTNHPHFLYPPTTTLTFLYWCVNTNFSQSLQIKQTEKGVTNIFLY